MTDRLPVEKYRFIAHGIAAGCGRPPEVGPLTEAQAAYQKQYAEWELWKEQSDE